MLAFYQSQPGKSGYRKRLHSIWDSLHIFPCSEQNLADQARSVITKKLLPDMEIARIQMTAATLQTNLEKGDDSIPQSPLTPTHHPPLLQSQTSDSDSDLSFTVPPPTPPKAHSTPLLSPKLPTVLHNTCDSEVSFDILVPPHTPPQISQLEKQSSLVHSFSGHF